MAGALKNLLKEFIKEFCLFSAIYSPICFASLYLEGINMQIISQLAVFVQLM
jgi:hypothetical protein